jgi:hypothetical protein
MRTDYTFTPPEPSHSVADWFDSSEPSSLFDLKELADNGDAPEHVLAFAREFQRARVDWEQGAKDRPITYHPTSNAFQLFDGPWQMAMPHHAAWAVIEANFAVEGEPDTYVRRTAPVADVYEALIEADDEEGCRKLAVAIYERMNKIGQLNCDLVDLTESLKARLPVTR